MENQETLTNELNEKESRRCTLNDQVEPLDNFTIAEPALLSWTLCSFEAMNWSMDWRFTSLLLKNLLAPVLGLLVLRGNTEKIFVCSPNDFFRFFDRNVCSFSLVNLITGLPHKGGWCLWLWKYLTCEHTRTAAEAFQYLSKISILVLFNFIVTTYTGMAFLYQKIYLYLDVK